jgi:hypothetical protein
MYYSQRGIVLAHAEGSHVGKVEKILLAQLQPLHKSCRRTRNEAIPATYNDLSLEINNYTSLQHNIDKANACAYLDKGLSNCK